MRFGGGLGRSITHPEQWLETVKQLGYRAAVFPASSRDSRELQKAYQSIMNENDILIGEVGVWNSPMTDGKRQTDAIRYCQEQLALAEEIGANCCVNIAGSAGQVWDSFDERNCSADSYALLVDITREIIDSVNPKRTFYTLEPMPWMFPNSPDSYLSLIRDIDRPAFGVHLDYANMINGAERYLNRHAFIRECFEKLGPYIKSIHVKDVRIENGLPCVIREDLPGRGGIDFRLVIRLANRLGPDTTIFTEHLETFEEYLEAAECLRAAARQEQIKS